MARSDTPKALSTALVPDSHLRRVVQSFQDFRLYLAEGTLGAWKQGFKRHSMRGEPVRNSAGRGVSHATISKPCLRRHHL